MLRILASTALLGLTLSAAFAADIPAYEPPASMAPLPAGGNWSGFYAGLHGGYGWADFNVDDFGDIDDLDGFLIGGHVGAAWQWNAIVGGLEADGTYSDISGGGDDVDADINWLASVRARVGVGFDRFLVYGTGGVGFGGVEAAVDVDDDDNAHVGWVAGGGAEYMLTQNVSVGAEYLHYDFSERDYDIGPGFEADGNVDAIRGRVNLKLDGLFGQ